jgi:small subunit ribosomal protein S13
MIEKHKTLEKERAGKQKPGKPEKLEKDEKKNFQEEESEILVRIMGHDLPGSKNIYSGLTRIKGISWSIANVVCVKLKIPRNKKISEFSKDEIVRIEDFLKKISMPDFLKNRRYDEETNETRHLFGSDLDIRKEFDIKKMKETKSYKGMRHIRKLPVRGQRTRSHFRTKKITMGVRKKKE